MKTHFLDPKEDGESKEDDTTGDILDKHMNKRNEEETEGIGDEVPEEKEESELEEKEEPEVSDEEKDEEPEVSNENPIAKEGAMKARVRNRRVAGQGSPDFKFQDKDTRNLNEDDITALGVIKS